MRLTLILYIGKGNNYLAKNVIVYQEQSFPSILFAASDYAFVDFSLPSYSDLVKVGVPKNSLTFIINH